MTTMATAEDINVLHFNDAAPSAGLEWIVTNGLGGYASGPVRGGLTRRFHGLLIASLAAPAGRMLVLPVLRVALVSGDRVRVIDDEDVDNPSTVRARLVEFRLELGLPVWIYDVDGVRLTKRVVMPYGQNTTHAMFSIEGGSGWLRLQPLISVRPHENQVDTIAQAPHRLDAHDGWAELEPAPSHPIVRWKTRGRTICQQFSEARTSAVSYSIEQERGYDHQGELWTPGWIDVEIAPEAEVAFTISTESREAVDAEVPGEALARERARREQLLATAGQPCDPVIAELTLAADQFVVLPVGRPIEIARARAAGDEPRTVIAGYHWFTDWGRDTMISLEGLTLATGRTTEAGCILRTFGHHVRDGLIPNMFPEGERLGLYHTADATLWFFHAIHRYVERTGDRGTLHGLLPVLIDIIEHHLAGTRFGIGVDAADGLLRQGADGYQLTWMDAKMGDWVVTPRRGKAVEINALWHNALRLMAAWTAEAGDAERAAQYGAAGDRAQASFNRRFWNPATGHLFDVVDGETGDDPACRPNQVFAISLEHPVLDRERWQPVLDVVVEKLLTPYGLRTLSPDHPDFKATYHGDLRTRDAAYHQGTAWPWLLGSFIDAWLRANPGDRARARQWLAALPEDLRGSGLGTISEIYDALPPQRPAGCISQAWSVAEVLRAWIATSAS